MEFGGPTGVAAAWTRRDLLAVFIAGEAHGSRLTKTIGFSME